MAGCVYVPLPGFACNDRHQTCGHYHGVSGQECVALQFSRGRSAQSCVDVSLDGQSGCGREIGGVYAMSSPVSSSTQNCSSYPGAQYGMLRYNGLRPLPSPSGVDWLRDQAFMGLEFTWRLQPSRCFQEELSVSGKAFSPLWFSGQLATREAPVGFPTLESLQIEEELAREPKLPPLRTETEILLAHYIPCYVMLPLDAVTKDNVVSHPERLMCNLKALRAAGVDGVMADVWWGVVEQAGPKHYDWSGYEALFKAIQSSGLKLQVVMSFHQCGGNTGDSCYIPLPPWILKAGEGNPDIYFTNRDNMRNQEYLSFGVDDEPVLAGRTAVQVYYDFMRSFRENFSEFLESGMITEVEVGLGPAGELRYPSYPETHGWRFPGIGEFQCYDKYLLGQLREAANSIGQYEWGYSGPHDAGRYNDWPQSTGFFCNHGSFNTDYGRFFLEWYSNVLLKHGDRVLEAATSAFEGCQTKLAAKVAGVHWWYNSRNHAAELAAGYYNLRERDGYRPIAKTLARHDAMLNFTCIEMRNNEQYWEARCGPEALVEQVLNAGWAESLEVACENALPRYDAGAFDQIILSARPEGLTNSRPKRRISSFTFLRLCPDLLHERNWSEFVRFVRRMHAGLDYHPEPEPYFRPRGRVRRSKPAQAIPDMPPVLLNPSPSSLASPQVAPIGPEPFFTQDAPGGGLGLQVGEMPTSSSPANRGSPRGRDPPLEEDLSTNTSGNAKEAASERGSIFGLLPLFPRRDVPPTKPSPSSSTEDMTTSRETGMDVVAEETEDIRPLPSAVEDSGNLEPKEEDSRQEESGNITDSVFIDKEENTTGGLGPDSFREEPGPAGDESTREDMISPPDDGSAIEGNREVWGQAVEASDMTDVGIGKGQQGMDGRWEGSGRPEILSVIKGEEERGNGGRRLLMIVAAAVTGAAAGFVVMLVNPGVFGRPTTLDGAMQGLLCGNGRGEQALSAQVQHRCSEPRGRDC